jgi:hypothetical protein
VGKKEREQVGKGKDPAGKRKETWWEKERNLVGTGKGRSWWEKERDLVGKGKGPGGKRKGTWWEKERDLVGIGKGPGGKRKGTWWEKERDLVGKGKGQASSAYRLNLLHNEKQIMGGWALLISVKKRPSWDHSSENFYTVYNALLEINNNYK